MLIGEIAAPFGVRGEMKIDPFTDFPDRFKSLRVLYVGPSRQPYEVEGARLQKQQVVLKLAGIERPEQVDELRRREVFVPRSEAAALPAGHYYLDDLIGAQVVTSAGQPVGTLTDILRTGSNDVYVVADGGNEILIPAIKDAVTSVDVGERRVVIEPWVLQNDQG